jgi:hypothetical protein
MKKHIIKDGVVMFVDAALAETYVKYLGWSIGTGKNKEANPKKPKATGAHLVNYKWITDGVQNKRVHINDLGNHPGWRLGRTGYGEKMAAKKWLTLDGKDRRVDPEELENHPIPPWAKGRSFRCVFTDEAKKKISDGQKARYARERRLKNEV